MPKERERLNISIWLHDILDELHLPHANRYTALMTLIEQIDDVTSFEHKSRDSSVPGLVMSILLRGFSPFFMPADVPSKRDHVLTAAILLDLEDVYGPLLETYTQPLEYRRYECYKLFGSPLYAAVKSGNHKLVQRLLSKFDTAQELGFIKPLEGAVKINDLAMVGIVLNDEEILAAASKKGFDLAEQMEQLPLPPLVTDSILVDDMKRALIRCSRLGRTAMARHLFNYVSRRSESLPGIIGKKEFLAQLMYYASLYGYIDFMDLVLENGGDIDTVREARDPYPCELATWRGDVAMTRWIMDHDKGPWPMQVVLTAILSGDLDCLKMVIEYDGTGNNLSPEEWLTLCWYGIRLRQYRAVSYLLEELKVVDLVAEFRRQPTQYGTVMEVCASEGHPEGFEMLLRLGFPYDQPLCQGNNGINEDWTPMMFCQASENPGAKKVQERLKELGVTEVDMMQTKASHLFEIGYYPKGSLGVESQMPAMNGIEDKRSIYFKSTTIEVNCRLSKETTGPE